LSCGQRRRQRWGRWGGGCCARVVGVSVVCASVAWDCLCALLQQPSTATHTHPHPHPQAVRNFVQLCLEGAYDGCIFHRVLKDFMAQTGDPTGTGTGVSVGVGGGSGAANHRASHRRLGLGLLTRPTARYPTAQHPHKHTHRRRDDLRRLLPRRVPFPPALHPPRPGGCRQPQRKEHQRLSVLHHARQVSERQREGNRGRGQAVGGGRAAAGVVKGRSRGDGWARCVCVCGVLVWVLCPTPPGAPPVNHTGQGMLLCGGTEGVWRVLGPGRGWVGMELAW
jgi:hypothetical protein